MQRYPVQSLFASSSRCFSSSSRAQSHIGSSPIPVPATISLTLPSSSVPTNLSASSPLAQRSLTISGPKGSHTLSLAPAIILHPAAGSLSFTVQDPTSKPQRALWGLTRALVRNAVEGVATGYTVNLKLVGVGYRGAVEPIPDFILQRRAPVVARPGTNWVPPTPPTERLNLKLGYAHPILIDIPQLIKVTTPAPTQIVLEGTDKQALGLFAAKIRRWRKPEPYRGKVRLPSFPHRADAPLRVSLLATRRSSSRRSRKSKRPGCRACMHNVQSVVRYRANATPATPMTKPKMLRASTRDAPLNGLELAFATDPWLLVALADAVPGVTVFVGADTPFNWAANSNGALPFES